MINLFWAKSLIYWFQSAV